MALRIRHTTRERPAVTPEKKAHPLFWLLVLVAFLVIAWSLYNRYASQASAAVLPTGTATPAATRPADRSVQGQPLRPARTSRPPHP